MFVIQGATNISRCTEEMVAGRVFYIEVLQSLEFCWQGVPCLNVQSQDDLYMNTAAL